MSLLSGITKIRPHAVLDALFTYPRFLGAIKPELLGRSAAETRARLRGLGGAWWPKQLEVEKGKRILVVAPHPDDETIGAGGYLLRHRGKSEIHLLMVFNGEGGGQLDSGPRQDTLEYRSRLIAARKEEACEIGRRLRVESLRHLDFPDGSLSPDKHAASELRAAIDQVNPDIVLLPWYLDCQNDHRTVNILYAWACQDLPAMVLSFEIWEMLQPNAIMDIGDVFEEKLDLVRCYRTQTGMVDYVGMCQGLAKARAFFNPVRPDRGGAVEAFFALPSKEYCELVQAIYGLPGDLSAEGHALLSADDLTPHLGTQAAPL
jgi:LmbE family N-acetylglucosaminyl deacetylase